MEAKRVPNRGHGRPEPFQDGVQKIVKKVRLFEDGLTIFFFLSRIFRGAGEGEARARAAGRVARHRVVQARQPPRLRARRAEERLRGAEVVVSSSK